MDRKVFIIISSFRSTIYYLLFDESVDKRRQSLSELAISGRRRNHYLCLLVQSYSAIPKTYEGKLKPYLIGTQRKEQILR